MVTTNTEYTEIIDGEEFVEVTGDGGGDFPDTISFRGDEPIVIFGTFDGTKTNVGPNKSSVHDFSNATVQVGDNDVVPHDEVQAWGAAFLDSRLKDIDPGTKVKVVYTGQRVPTPNGSAKEFKVFASAKALT